ncbi:MAG: quinate 5-dehydrogenase [bacterium]
MKKVVSVSIGSSKRNKTVEATFLNHDFQISREGTDGDFNKAIERIRQLDGKIDCFGLGGADLYLWRKTRKYIVRDALRMARAAKITPIVDGSDVKHTLERKIIGQLGEMGILKKGMKCLLVSGIDRWGMAESLAELGLDMTYGDLIVALGVNYPIPSLKALDTVGKILLPIFTRLPFKLIYPTGEKQESQKKKKIYEDLFSPQDILAGDFHYIRRYMPDKLDGKIVITNTTTEEDHQELTKRGVKLLITTTPVIDGRSFGANVLQAVMVSLLEKRPEDLTWDDYLKLIEIMKLGPTIRELN